MAGRNMDGQKAGAGIACKRIARGFTLIEISIVIVIVGLLLSGGLLAVAPFLEGAKYSETNDKLDRIEKALVVWAIQNQCLPCPADVLVTDNTGGLFGIAQNGGGAAQTACQSPYAVAPDCQHTDIQAIVPWRTLGLTRDDAIDGWGNFFHYRPDIDFTQVDDDGLGGLERCGSFYPDGDGGGVDDNTAADCSAIGDPASVDELTVNDAAGNPLTTEAAYVIVSFGPDGADAYNSQVVVQADAYNSANQNANSDTGTDYDDVFVQDDLIDLQGNTRFDDIVRWKTAPLIIQECGAGSCGNPD